MNKVFGTLSIAVMAAATAVYFLNSWPATVINQWQLKINGDKYFPALTIFLMALPPLLVLFVIKLAVIRLRKK